MLQRPIAFVVFFSVALLAVPAAAVDLHHRVLLGLRVSDFLSADEQKGGFRAFGGTFEGGERGAKLREVPTLSASVGYGLAKVGKKAELLLELHVERISTTLSPETVYRDRDASTRIIFYANGTPFQNGDEQFTRLAVGDVTMTPVFVNALLQWGSGRGRGDFYVGAGPGVVFASVSESPEFREFKKDYDGVDDVVVDNAFGLMLKAGSNIRLSKSGSWLLYLETEFISTALLTSQSQVAWSESNFFAGLQDIDTDFDNLPDRYGVESDLRIVDHGKVRLDGATIGLGLRYRFGGRQKATAAEDAGAATAEPPATPAP